MPTTSNAAISIRPISSVADCIFFQTLERTVWESSDEDVMPVHVLITAIKNGGVMLGAFAEDGPPETGKMVGAVFGWPGIVTGEGQPTIKFCSHIAGVLPAWQGRGLGVQLKLAQRQAILALGYTDWVTWTYDPLYRVNGVLNIHRLGATCNTYYRNVYGMMTDSLNAGAPTDRCQVDWRLNSERVRAAAGELSPSQHPAWAQSDPAADTWQVLSATASGEFRQPVEQTPAFDGRPLAVPLPQDIAAIRRSDGGLAMAWRLYIRHVFEAAFAAGYMMVDCRPLPDHEWYYFLEKRNPHAHR